MGLTFSRSVRFGPVRFNFSGSGIGVSTGIRGLRIGHGPRGAYISAGTHGFRYRANLGQIRRASSGQGRLVRPATSPTSFASPSGAANITHLQEHDSTSVLDLTDSSGDELLASMNEQSNKLPLWPFIACLFVALIFATNGLMQAWPGWTRLILPVLGIAATLFMRHRDQLKTYRIVLYPTPRLLPNSLN